MCGRYVLTKSAEVIQRHFDLFEPPERPVRAHYNIAPTQLQPVVRRVGDRRELTWMKWGLIPPWAKDPAVGSRMINARSETVGEKPAYRGPIQKQRCLVPADGFFEWQRDGKTRQPYYVGLKEPGLYASAGIWSSWTGGGGQHIESFSILTVPANDLIAPIHDRMPLILKPDDYNLWLDPGVTRPELLEHLFVPFEPEAMLMYPVSTRVNSVRNDGPELLDETDPRRGKNLELFDL